MAKVIQILPSPERVSSESPVLKYIDECYEKLEKLPSFTIRKGQKNLSYEICRSILAKEPLMAQAPTGTGKTIAYLIGALAASEVLSKEKQVPIVVATGTVVLQDQILNGDLPKLVEAGLISEQDFAVAKGRGRYFCIASAERLAETGEFTSQVDFFDEEKNNQNLALEEVDKMLEYWFGGAWRGDVDSYVDKKPSSWNEVSANAETCLGIKCDHFKSCPFFNSRRALGTAKLIVANHDIVLSDLKMYKKGLDPLFTSLQYICIFDEAHHLPNKALESATAKLDLEKELLAVEKLMSFNKIWKKHPEILKVFERNKLDDLVFDAGSLKSTLLQIKDESNSIYVDEESLQRVFENSSLPENLRTLCSTGFFQAESLFEYYQKAAQCLKQLPVENNDSLKKAVIEVLYYLALISSTANNLSNCFNLLSDTSKSVKWLFKSEGVCVLFTSPFEGDDVLRDLLWENERVFPALVSATLKDFEGFERFKARSGIPSYARNMTLDYIFNYKKNGIVQVVNMQFSPQQEEKLKFRQELYSQLPRFIDPQEATLILFSSREVMREATKVLKENFDCILVQEEQTLKDLIKRHKQNIDRGKGSVLCGLDSLAEGLDLPGKYCTHVIVTSLPFTVPITPVEVELRKKMGKDYFLKKALPDTLIKLTQMTGRLIRSETDTGVITIFDNRILYSKWGFKLREALPPFKWKVAPKK